jgi:hypothetical protein
LEGLWTFATQAVLGVGQTIRAVVNPKLTLELRLDAGTNAVIIVAIGAAAFLGHSYMVRAKNNSGQSGERSGNLNQNSQIVADVDPSYTLSLPSGIDFSEGIYGIQLQLPIELDASSVASNPLVVFESFSKEKMNTILAGRVQPRKAILRSGVL